MQDIDLYYESLKEVYDQILSWEQPKPKRSLVKRILIGLLVVSVVLLIGSIIPVLPLLFLYTAARKSLIILSFDLRVATIGHFPIILIIGVFAGSILFSLFALFLSK